MEGRREEKIEGKNKKYINMNKNQCFTPGRLIGWDESGRSGPQLHSLFSELFYTVQPSDSNECWLWPLVFGSSVEESFLIARSLHAPTCSFSSFLCSFPTSSEASLRAQSTVDGFYVIHTKTHRQRWMFTEASKRTVTVSRADKTRRGVGGEGG